MAPTIAVQVQRGLQAEADASQAETERVTGKRVKRTLVPIPVVRKGPEALCQNVDFLLMVTEYSYELSDQQFQDYCEARGALHLAGVPGSTRWGFFVDHSKSKEDYVNNSDCQFAQGYEGSRHRFTPEEMESGWKVIRIGRAKLQDCWEVFRTSARA
jgi:hypothetical protein